MNNFVQNALGVFMEENGEGLTDTQKEYINVIKDNNVSKGEKLAMNLCKSMGLSREQAYQQATNFFARRFPGKF